MKKLLILSAITVFILVTAGLCAALEMAIEAELATKIEAPMEIGVATDGSKNGGTDAVNPSRGKFVWAPGKPVEGGANGNKGFVQFKFNMTKAGKYAIWARVIAWDGNSDSFWVTWEPADPNENSQQTNNLDFRWSVANGIDWHWDRIEAWKADDSHTDRVWDIPAGPTTLTIYCREDAAMLDSIFITDNLSSDEAVAKPRVPTDQDIAALSGTASVSSIGKLATTWGNIR